MNSTLPQRFKAFIIKMLMYVCVSYFHDLTCPLLMWEIKEKPKHTKRNKNIESPMPILLDIFPASYLYMALKSFPLWKHFQCVTHGIFEKQHHLQMLPNFIQSQIKFTGLLLAGIESLFDSPEKKKQKKKTKYIIFKFVIQCAL